MERLVPKIPGLAYGGDYNPEQWPESIWREDLRLMREAGVNLVSVGVFSWAKLQPAPRRWDFAWLDRLMDLLAEHEIRACLATATASPPPWLARLHPDSLPLDRDLRPLWPGGRQHYSPCSPHYRRHAARLVERLAARYGAHPALALWHVNNEYACHIQECHGEHTTRAFRAWLRRRYGSIAALNAAWGTAFWSQGYGRWDEIVTPRRVPAYNNPAQELDYRRFFSDAVLGLYRMEKAILNRRSPGIPVTTNLMGLFKPLDYRRWAEHLDCAAWDSYPDPGDGAAGNARSGAFAHDLTRSLKPDRPFLLMEQAPSFVNWREVNRPKPPGRMRLTSWQAVARGADAVMFFQWRASLAGAEQFHSAMVPHTPPERSRVFGEVKALGAELARLAPVAGSLVRAHAAVLHDWEAMWALDLPAKPARLDNAALAAEAHACLWRANLAADLVHPGADLSRYRLLVAPALYLLGEGAAQRLTAWVQAGGTLLVTYFSGIVDEASRVVPGGYPGFLRATLGLWVEEWAPLAPGETVAVRFAGRSGTVAACEWSETVHLAGARARARFADGFARGGPALTEHRLGRGRALYCATRLPEAELGRLLRALADQSGVAAPLAAPAGVEAVEREAADGRRFLFLLNHTERAVRVRLPRGARLLPGDRAASAVALAPLDAVCVALEPLHP